MRRAKERIEGVSKTPTPPTEQARKLVEQFLAAAATGEMNGVLALLTEDSAVYSDGGGKVKAAGFSAPTMPPASCSASGRASWSTWTSGTSTSTAVPA